MANLFYESFERFWETNENIGDSGLTLLKQTLDRTTFAERTTLEPYLEWCRHQPLVKVTESLVPVGILPYHCQCSLIDIKVQGKYGVADDAIYESSKEIRDKVARGNCILAIRRLDKIKNVKYKFVIRGLKKFSGGMGDEDEKDDGGKIEDDQNWKKYFTKSVDKATTVISLKKENGEAAHLSVRIENGVRYFFIGSKNVHLLIRHRGDIAKYVDQRYEMAKKIAHAVCDTLEKLNYDQLEMLVKFMHLTEMTAIMEVLQNDYMHVEDLSHLLRNKLIFITWTSTSDDASLCALPPTLGIEVAASFGLSTVKYEQCAMKNVNLKMNEIRKGYGYEGEVLYFLDETNVFGLIKKKTIWYIVLRATREKMKMLLRKMAKSPTNALADTIKKMEIRLKDFQKWLELEDSEVSSWQTLSVGFLHWICDQLKQRDKEIHSLADGQFPVLWKEYLDTPGKKRLIKKLYPSFSS